MSREIPAAIQYLRDLHSQPASPALRRTLDSFNATPQSHDAFKHGVQEFTRIANLNYQERAPFFGNSFCGVHYDNDLTAQWNATSSETISEHQLRLIAPQGWDYRCEEYQLILVYKGNDPAGALDRLLQGPTVIDCGMFCQLSIWFGIRSALGNEKFNQLFGSTPFYITQFFYNGIDDPLKPYSGNPLFDFFERTAATQSVSQSVSIAHVASHPEYQLKHPSGSWGGSNSVVLHGFYTKFSPLAHQAINLSLQDIREGLFYAFNESQNEDDKNKILAYQKLDQSEIHPGLGFTYSQLIQFATMLADKTIEESEFYFPVLHQLSFNFERFMAWTQQRLQRDFSPSASYQPLSDSELSVSATLTAMIPFENRHGMSFSTYRQESILHQQLYQQSLHFCHSVMGSQSCMVVLTGRAGIGKTAAAVSCAKELVSRGKNVVWITEVTVKGWMDQAKSTEELSQSQTEIRRLLATNPDAVFLDDDNIVGYAGQVLLEEIYTWYICNPGKGLFITSNETVSFEKCFGLKFDKQYYFVPFTGYLNPAMQGIVINANLNGQSQRPTLAISVADLNDHEKMMRLMCVPQSARSVGVVVTSEAYQAHERELGNVEFVPGFKSLSLITMHLCETKGKELGPAYDALSDVQKRWTYRFPLPEIKFVDGMSMLTNRYLFRSIGIIRFEQSSCDVIAVELLRQPKDWKGQEVNDDCVAQLLRVINYAHDRGGKKIIIVNATGFSQQELITQIKMHIDERDKERTIARLDQLFYSSELLVERTPVELPRSTSGALICRPSTGAVAVDPLNTDYNEAAFFQLAWLQRTSQTASPDGAPQCFHHTFQSCD